MKIFFYLLLLTSVIACTAPQHIRQSNYYTYDLNTISAKGQKKADLRKHHPSLSGNQNFAEGPADYEKNVNYFFLGNLPRNYTVNLSEACGKKEFRQAYAEHTFLQAAVSVLTLGLYTPRKIKVWCQNEARSI